MSVYDIFGIVGLAALILTALRYFFARPGNLLVCYIQNFVASLFIFSGFVKAVDPLGTGYKMHEYFEAFANEKVSENLETVKSWRGFWEYIAGFSTFMAIGMIALELFVGFMLLIGWRPRLTVTLIWWLTLFFTFLTGYTYLSGYGISHSFILSSLFVMLVLAAAPLFKDSKKRNITFYAAAFFMVVMFLMGKFTGLFFTKEFAESGMKVTDCGCFGDFIKLKPWETFYKDVFLDVFIAVLVFNIKHIRPLFTQMVTMSMAIATGAVSLFLCLYCTYLNEPVLDFRPYAIGQDLNANMKDIKPRVVKMVFIYKDKTTGAQKRFSMEDMSKPEVMKEMENMEYVDRSEDVIDEGIPARISNLFIENDEGAPVIDSIMHNPGYSLMVTSFDLNKTHQEAFAELNAIAEGCNKAGIQFFAVVSNDGKVEEFRARNKATGYRFFYADATPLKTMIRSNPGLMLLKNGVVINKWHYRHLPTFDELNANYFKK